jgi:hypothetical protein
MGMLVETQAVAELKDQGVSVTVCPGDEGSIYWVSWSVSPDAYFLSTPQLLHLKELGKLTLEGVRQLHAVEVATVRNDIESARAEIGPERMQTLTTSEIREYINKKFDRIHSTGQIAAVFESLHYAYKKF